MKKVGCYVLCFFLISCASNNMMQLDSSKEVMQHAQQALSDNNVKLAYSYYEYILDNFSFSDYSYDYIEASYQIAFLLYKKKDYSKSMQKFMDILTLYADSSVELPAAFRVLSNKMLQKIELITTKKQKDNDVADISDIIEDSFDAVEQELQDIKTKDTVADDENEASGE